MPTHFQRPVSAVLRLLACGATAAFLAASPAAAVNSFLDTFWGGTPPQSQPSPLGNYDYKIGTDGTMRVNPPYTFLDQVEGNDGMIAGLEMQADGRVSALNEQAEVIGWLAIDNPQPRSSISIDAAGMLIIVSPNGPTIWQASQGVSIVAAGDSDQSSGTRAEIALEGEFLPVTLTTMFRKPEGECFTANFGGQLLDSDSHMAPCREGGEGDQAWRIYPVSPDEGLVRIASVGPNGLLCLSVIANAPTEGMQVETCRDTQEHIFRIVPVEGQDGYFRIQSAVFGEERCLEGNRVAQDAVLGGSAFMDTCQNVSGQLWTFGRVLM